VRFLYGELDLRFMRAEIGVAILFGVVILIAFHMLQVFPYSWMLVYTVLAEIPSPLAFCVFVGMALCMALYISDRRSFLNRRSGDKSTAVWLAILGLILILEGVFDGYSVLVLMRVDAWIGGSWTWEKSIMYLFAFAFSGLVFLSGGLLLSDQEKMLEDKSLHPPSVRRLDVETKTKYPRALFAKYAQQYPHNPEGVLEWHIHKKVKEGKTREQAIKELMHA